MSVAAIIQVYMISIVTAIGQATLDTVASGFHMYPLAGAPLDQGSGSTSDLALAGPGSATSPGDGYLTITGRIKDEYKLSNGKYVNPVEVEDVLSTHIPSIKQIIVYGDGRDYNVAVVVSNDNEEHTLTKMCGVSSLRKFDFPKRLHITQEPFSVENGMLTAKMSMRREVILKHYQKEIDELYAK